MFESAEIPHTIPKERYAEEVPGLRQALLKAQYDLLSRGNFGVIVLVAGVDGGGKGDTVNLLNEWLDPRHIRTRAMGEPSDEEQERPQMWRFWRTLPPKGRISVMFGSWYTPPILERAYDETTEAELDQALERVRNFEKMLSEEGVLLIKLWFHLSKEQQRKRLKKLQKDKRTRWRVTDTDWKHFKLYDTFVRVSAHALRETSTHSAPWQVVAGAEARYRNLTVGRAVLNGIRQRLDAPSLPRDGDRVLTLPPSVDGRHILQTLDLTASIPKKKYRDKLEGVQGRINRLTRDPRFHRRALVGVFEGWDASGKGGVIRRITQALDARTYHVVPIGAPTDEEKAQPYLWRFWRYVPRKGRVVLFDRSWYGRVLVERVEKLAATADWMRAYAEINDFEEQLVENGVVLCKFWLHIDPEEQLRRFQEREKTGFKRYKITEEDWRNRDRWRDYELAVSEMIDRTSTEIAPWTLVEANDKRYARIKTLGTLCDRLEQTLKED